MTPDAGYHGPPDLTVSRMLSIWHTDPALLLGFVVITAAYLTAVVTARRRGGHPWPLRRSAAFRWRARRWSPRPSSAPTPTQTGGGAYWVLGHAIGVPHLVVFRRPRHHHDQRAAAIDATLGRQTAAADRLSRSRPRPIPAVRSTYYFA